MEGGIPLFNHKNHVSRILKCFQASCFPFRRDWMLEIQEKLGKILTFFKGKKLVNEQFFAFIFACEIQDPRF